MWNGHIQRVSVGLCDVCDLDRYWKSKRGIGVRIKVVPALTESGFSLQLESTDEFMKATV